ncbi:MAG: hypothetical protein JW881_20335 [Spirochaetales bacterium]|nr:hypothetical protein [Spirochaetales bacterium]
MVIKKITGLVLVLSVFFSIGCRLGGEFEETEVLGPEMNRTLSKSVYMGGSVIVAPEEPAINQLYEGMNIPIRIAEAGEGPEENEKVCWYRARFVEVESSYVAFYVVKTDEEGNAAGEACRVELGLGENADLDGNGEPDICLVKADREGMAGACYLTFASSPGGRRTAMFSLLPEDLPGKRYPSGIAGLNPSGRLLVVRDSAYGVPALTLRAGDPLAGIVMENDILISSSPVSASLGRVTGVKQSGDSTVILLQTIPAEKFNEAYELLYMKAEGTVSDFYDEASGSRGRFDLFKGSFNFDRVVAYSIHAGFDIDLDLDLYLDATVSAGWDNVRVELTSYAIIDSTIEGYLELPSAMEKEEEEAVFLCKPTAVIMVGPVAVTVSVPCYLGYKASASAKCRLSQSVDYNGEIGFKGLKVKGYVDWCIPKLSVNTPTVVSNHSITVNPPAFTAAAKGNFYPYLYVVPDIAPGGVVHIKEPTKIGLDVNASLNTYCTTTKYYYYNYGLQVGYTTVCSSEVYATADFLVLSNPALKLDFGLFDLSANIPINIEYRRRMGSWTYKF